MGHLDVGNGEDRIKEEAPDMKIVFLKTGKTRKGHSQPDQTLVNQTNTGAVVQSDQATNSAELNWKNETRT